MTVTGTGFIGASAVDFGTTAAMAYTVTSTTQITATSPAEAAGTVDVTVTTPVGDQRRPVPPTSSPTSPRR